MKIEQDPKLSPGASLDYQQRHERGRDARRMIPRGSHAQWAPMSDRPDPADLLEAQARDRIQELSCRVGASPHKISRPEWGLALMTLGHLSLYGALCIQRDEVQAKGKEVLNMQTVRAR